MAQFMGIKGPKNQVVHCPGREFSFLRIHKNACSALTHPLMNSGYGGRIMPKDQWVRFGQYCPGEAKPKLVVMWRDPFKRTESVYRYMMMDDRQSYRERNDLPRMDDGFRNFVLRLGERGEDGLRTADSHIVPQRWHAHWNDTYLPDVELWWDFGAFAALFGVTVPRLNESAPMALPEWDQEMHEAMAAAYPWDIQKWRDR